MRYLGVQLESAERRLPIGVEVQDVGRQPERLRADMTLGIRSNGNPRAQQDAAEDEVELWCEPARDREFGPAAVDRPDPAVVVRGIEGEIGTAEIEEACN